MKPKRTMSASARRKIAAAQRARWAKVTREESGLGLSDSGRTNDSSHLQTEEKVYAACNRGGKRARDRGDYAIGAVITRLIGKREVVIASAGNRVKTSGSSIKHVELETLKYVSSGYGRYLPDFVLYPRTNLVLCARAPASGQK